MKQRVLPKIRTSATPPQVTQASSPLLHQKPSISELSESLGSNSNLSKEVGGIQPKTIRRSLNWQNITVEAPSRGNGVSLPGGIQRQQEEPPAVMGEQVSADSVQKSPLESSNSTISTDLSAQKPLIARAPFNGRNIPVEAPSRGNGMSLPGGIQRQQEEPPAVIGEQVSADSVQKSPLESSNSTISTDLSAQKPLIARAPFNGRNIPVEAPQSSSASSTYPGGIQRLETTGVKEQEESTEPLQMQPQGAIQAHSSEGQPQEKEEQNKELVQTKLTVGAPGDKYEQEADSMAAKVMRMPDEAVQQPVQRQTDEETEAVQMQPLVNSITPLVQRKSGTEEEVQMKSGAKRASDGSSQASGSVESRLAGSKGGGSPLPNDIRSFMEARFGADFSSVRVHTDSNAVQMNKELGAQAFAHGSDIYYGAGKSPGKDELTAHELTHTIQQGGAVPTKSVTGHQKKENKLQAKADAIQLTSVEAKIQRKENPQAQPAAAKVAPQTPAASPSAKSEKGEPANTIEKPAPGGGAGAPSTPAGNGGGAGAGASSGAGAGASSGGAAGAGTGGGGPNSPKSAQNDPGFKAVVNSTKSVAAQEKNHPPAGKKSAEAQAAAVSPANEVESKAQNKQVQEMNQQQPGQFNAGAFKAALMEKISAATPQTLEEADNFKDQNKLDSVKGDLSSQVSEEKKQAANPIEEKTKEQPDASGIGPKSVIALPPKQAGKAPSDIGANKAAPKPKSKSEVSLQEGSKSIDKQMADAKITERQLASSNEPQFQTALESKKTAQTHANTAPNAYRQQEQGIVTQAQAQAQTTAQTQLQGMHGEREQLLTQVVGLQTDTKGQDEQKRSQVANHIQGIYNNTKQKVETALSQLDGEVNQQFDSGAAAAKTQFENYVDQRMKRYKDERYSGLVGKGKWVKDKLFGMPSEVNTFYQEGKSQFLASMSQTIDKIANKVATKLNSAKAEIAKGRQEIQKYVASLDPSLRQVGQEAAQNIGAKFDELEQSVENKQNELIDSLAQKYNENLQVLDTQINEMKASNRGLMNKAMDAMGGAIKIILEMKNLLMGVLAKAAGAADKIILDPIGFLGNLVGGLKQGFQNFQSNSDQHLQKGMVGWLTGTLASTGVEMPESFDMKGIFSLTTQVLGTTYQAIRPRAVKAIGKNGEESVSALESNFEMFVILKNEGVGGLWQFIQDKIGDLKSMVIDTIKSFVVETVIKQGIMWILSLLNPASAFVRACKAIIDIIMFFVQRGSQIVELVNAVIESVTAIANGAVGGAAKAIENAMSKALPVLIGFMASLLGLGGITDKIQNIIKRVRGPIDKAIDWVIGKATKHAKSFAGKFNKTKVGKKLGAAKESALKKKEATDKWVNQKKEAAQKRFEQNKAAVQKGLEDKKNQLLNTKAGKKLAAADEWANKKLAVLEKKREAFNNKLETVKEAPAKKLAALEEKAQGLKGATKDKFKQSKFGQKLEEKLDVTKDLGNKKKDAIKNKDGKDSNKQDDLEHSRKVKKGLAHLHQEESRYAQNGKIAHKDAKKVAAKVKSKHSIFKSITVVGGVGEWKYEYVASPAKQEPSDYEIVKIIEKFGNQYRDPNVDPDKSGEGGVFQGGQRVDDAPIVEDFRKSYNQLESWNILIKQKHPELYEDFKIKFDTPAEKKPGVRTKRDELIKKIKVLTTEYKTKFRNLEERDTAPIKTEYEKEVNSIKAEIDSLLTQIASWYKSNNNGKEAENVHNDGTELWRQAWKDAIVKVNTILERLWPQAKANIKAWVEQKKSALPHVNMEGEIGELDYIGSLAKGYKGPPKQHVRFNPEDFDVDANLKAPPLAAYAMKVDNVTPDRKRIFGRRTKITPLNDFSDQAHNELIKVEGINDDPKDKFDVVIEAEETTEQEQTRESTEKLYRLRPPKLSNEDYQDLIKKLKDKNLLEQGEGTVREDLTSQQFQELSEILADYKE